MGVGSSSLHLPTDCGIAVLKVITSFRWQSSGIQQPGGKGPSDHANIRTTSTLVNLYITCAGAAQCAADSGYSIEVCRTGTYSDV